MKIIIDVDILKTVEGIPTKNSIKSIDFLLKTHQVYIKGDKKWVEKHFKKCVEEIEGQVIITKTPQKKEKDKRVILFKSERFPNWKAIIETL